MVAEKIYLRLKTAQEREPIVEVTLGINGRIDLSGIYSEAG
jgi:hypothetical protein